MKLLSATATILACFSVSLLMAQEDAEKAEPAPVTDPAPAESAPPPKIEPAAPKPTLRPIEPPSTEPAPIAPLGDPEMELLPLIPDTPPALDLANPGHAIPQPEPELPDISQQLKSERAQAVENELRNRIRLRQVKTKALKDAQIQADWERAQTARTDYEKREALQDYYTRLYDRMTRLDSSLKVRIKELRADSLRRLRQHRIAPTEPLEPGHEVMDDEG